MSVIAMILFNGIWRGFFGCCLHIWENDSVTTKQNVIILSMKQNVVFTDAFC